MPQPLIVIGNYISPYVRKVLACLELKGLAYEIDPITPFVGNDDFTRLSPLRRVPVLIDGELVLNDSSVICQYLEDKHPQPSLYPADIAQRARARWLEEYADTYLADVLIWRLFYQQAVRRHIFKETPDETIVRHARETQIPAALDYLETQLPADSFVFGELSIADLSIAAYFRTASFVRYTVDGQRWMGNAGRARRRSCSGCTPCRCSRSSRIGKTRCCVCHRRSNAKRWPPPARRLRQRRWLPIRQGTGYRAGDPTSCRPGEGRGPVPLASPKSEVAGPRPSPGRRTGMYGKRTKAAC
jgi:glutathione S-transferase